MVRNDFTSGGEVTRVPDHEGLGTRLVLGDRYPAEDELDSIHLYEGFRLKGVNSFHYLLYCGTKAEKYPTTR